MGIAAVPKYLGNDFNETPPGHRFELYFPVWDHAWNIQDQAKSAALKQVLNFSKFVELLDSLRARQQEFANSLGNSMLALPAKSVAPFMTGMGMEHPLENGFAFLKPYGLPYLPGSGIKGVLRSAAEELALGLYGDTQGWDIVAVWWLFGFEPNASYLVGAERSSHEAEHRKRAYCEAVSELPETALVLARCLFQHTLPEKLRKTALDDTRGFLLSLQDTRDRRDALVFQGVLRFWDVLPKPAGGKLAIDIMTPHYSHYYQSGQPPHDSGQPTPIPFLTVPESSEFCFYLQCEVVRLPEALRQSWRALLKTAFLHAFDWLGFGAKTALGYGQMQIDEAAQQHLQEQKRAQRQKAEQAAHEAAMSPLDRQIEALIKSLQPGEQPGRLLRAIENGEFEPVDHANVARRIQTLLENAGKWRPNFEGTNRKKRKEYEVTQKVLNYLNNS